MSVFRSAFAVCAMLAVLFLAAAAAPVSAREAPSGTEVGGVTIVLPDEDYAGVPLGEWDARGWQWSLSLPEAINPSFNPAGEGCGYGQSGPVFFMPGNYTSEPITMTCVVPEGTAIYVSVAAVGCTTVEPPPFFGRDEAELRTCAADQADDIIGSMQLSINGEEVPDLEAYRYDTPLFTVTFPEGNFYGVPPSVALSVASGYGFIIAPPPPGEYEITGTVAFDFEEEPVANTTRIIVEAPQVIEPDATPATDTPMATPDA